MSYPGRSASAYRKKSPAVPNILPREPLTKKARAAIEVYATMRSRSRRGLNIHHFMVGYVLEAERMRRTRLYEILANNNYQWKNGVWRQRPALKQASSESAVVNDHRDRG